MTSAQPFSVEAFLEFCRSKPAEEGYPLLEADSCVMTLYGREVGLLAPKQEVYDHADLRRFHNDFWFDGLWPEPRTFGSLATRLERALAEQVLK